MELQAVVLAPAVSRPIPFNRGGCSVFPVKRQH